MITLKTKNFNIFNQSEYEKMIGTQQYMSALCACGSKGNYVIHGYYYRSIKAPFFKLRLRVLRIRCQLCGKTHAVLPTDIVPYSQVTFSTQLDVVLTLENISISKDILTLHPELDDSDIYRIKKRYSEHWRERLLSSLLDGISLLMHPSKLIQFCFTEYKRNFMQIKCTYNSIQSYNHIS